MGGGGSQAETRGRDAGGPVSFIVTGGELRERRKKPGRRRERPSNLKRGKEKDGELNEKRWTLCRLTEDTVQKRPMSSHSSASEEEAMLDRITFDSRILGGRTCIRGMRIPVSVIVGQIAHGASWDEVLADYPDLEPEDIQQALSYAAWLAQE